MRILWGLAGAALLAWIGLLLARGFFWWPWPRLTPPRSDPPPTPSSVVVVIPARNEADVLPETLPTVLMQQYAGEARVMLVDDRSEDETPSVARESARRISRLDRLEIVAGESLPHGWSGKVWAMHQGAAAAGEAKFLWFTDADIAHEPWVLAALVERADCDGLDLVSTMAKLRVDTWWDRLLVPAFVYFFAKLYPFRFVGDPRRRISGAAGGCMLVRREALERAGGLEAIRAALIDDCALARLIKESGGRLWLGFSRGVRSLRGYGSVASVWQMVARSAYTQLDHSALKLLATTVGMAFLYLLAPAACLGGAIAAGLGVPDATPLAVIGGTTWSLMAASFVPILRYVGGGWRVAPLLPIAGLLYTGMTVSSAWRHARGRGGAWKGRTY